MTFGKGNNAQNGNDLSKEGESCEGTSADIVTLQSLEALVNAQELLQLKEQVASLKLTGHLQAREARFYQVSYDSDCR